MAVKDPDPTGREVLINFTSFTMHGINVALLFIDFAANKLVVRRSHWSFVSLLICAYAFFHLTWQAVGNKAIYPFLNTSSWGCIAWYIGLLLFHWAMFFLCYA